MSTPTAIDPESSLRLTEQLADAPIRPVFQQCDLTNLGAIEGFLADVGPVDVLVNNAANDTRSTPSPRNSGRVLDRCGPGLKQKPLRTLVPL